MWKNRDRPMTHRRHSRTGTGARAFQYRNDREWKPGCARRRGCQPKGARRSSSLNRTRSVFPGPSGLAAGAERGRSHKWCAGSPWTNNAVGRRWFDIRRYPRCRPLAPGRGNRCSVKRRWRRGCGSDRYLRDALPRQSIGRNTGSQADNDHRRVQSS